MSEIEVEEVSLITDVEESEIEVDVDETTHTMVGTEIEAEAEVEADHEIEIDDIIPVESSSSDRPIVRKINDPSRTTDFIMSKYEFAQIVSFRAQQIAMGAPTMLPPEFHSLTEIELAEQELKQNCSPIIIERKCPNNVFEYFKASELFISPRFFTSELMKYNIKPVHRHHCA